MGDSSCDSHVSIDMDSFSFTAKEHVVKTSLGLVSVAVVGDQDKPALITYPDLGLNYMSCLQGLFYCQEASSILIHNFCIYHISPPGHELGAAELSSDEPPLSVDDLADQIAEVIDYFRLGSVMCMGVTAGAYILSLFAMKYPRRVMGLILISPVCKAPSWTEWLCSKVMSNLLYFCGMCTLVKELLLARYFSKGVRGSMEVPESDVVRTCRRFLGERHSLNFVRFLEALNEASSTTTSSISCVKESAVSVQLQSAGRWLFCTNRNKFSHGSLLFVNWRILFNDSSIIDNYVLSDVSSFKSTFSSDVSKSGTGSNSKVWTVKEEGATLSSVEMEVVLKSLRTAQLQVSKAKGVDSKRILDALVDVFVEEIPQFPEEKNCINELMSKKGYLVLLLVILWSFAVFTFLFTSSRDEISFTGPVLY